MEIVVNQIGVIHSPHKEIVGTPIQPKAANGIKGSVEVFPEFMDGLRDLEQFSHIYLIYYFHLLKKSSLLVTPFMDSKQRGVFSTRAPGRPNHIGISIVNLLRIEKNILYISDVDIVDSTPLLDIKPYVPDFDIRKVEKIGWLDDNVDKLSGSKDDGRFS